MCTMSDTERLQLLKEVAGTTVYDEKKQESLSKMEENKASIEKINETLEYMENKLEELSEEKEELDAYQKLDRDRRAVEYTLYDKELRRAREGLDDIEQARNEEVDRLWGCMRRCVICMNKSWQYRLMRRRRRMP